jgi:hypothetical protein
MAAPSVAMKKSFAANHQTKLLLISTIADVLYIKSRTFGDKKLSTQLAKDLNKMVADHENNVMIYLCVPRKY